MSIVYNEFLENIRKKQTNKKKTGKRFVQLFQKRRFAKNDRHMKTYQSLLI